LQLRNMIGIFAFFHISWQTSIPSKPGSIISRIIKSGLAVKAKYTAWLPSEAEIIHSLPFLNRA
jgi:hypothetical protein